MYIFRCLFAFIAALSLSSCGVVSPRMELGEEPHLSAFLVNRIVGHVKCELGRAILAEIEYDEGDAAKNHTKRRYPWLDDWAGTLTLTLQVEEKGSVSPGLTYMNPLTGLQTFTLGAGVSGSVDATRKQQTDYSFSIRKDFLSADFKRYNDPHQACRDEEGRVLIEGDLQIKDWLDSALFPYHLPSFVDSKSPNVLTDDITFLVTVNGNVTPTWKIVRFTANPTSPFFSSARSRTNEALIALGPSKDKKTPSPEVIEFRNIALIGSSLNIAVRNP